MAETLRRRQSTMTKAVLDGLIQAAKDEKPKDKPMAIPAAADYAKEAFITLARDKNYTIEEIVEWALKKGFTGSKERIRKEASRVLKVAGIGTA